MNLDTIFLTNIWCSKCSYIEYSIFKHVRIKFTEIPVAGNSASTAKYEISSQNTPVM